MILADSSIWIDHIRNADDALLGSMTRYQLLCHPFVVGEVALGRVRNCEEVVRMLVELPRARRAQDAEVLAFARRHKLHGKGIGYVDAHLLVSAVLTDDCALWTRDRNLAKVAKRLGVKTREA